MRHNRSWQDLQPQHACASGRLRTERPPVPALRRLDQGARSGAVCKDLEAEVAPWRHVALDRSEVHVAESHVVGIPEDAIAWLHMVVLLALA